MGVLCQHPYFPYFSNSFFFEHSLLGQNLSELLVSTETKKSQMQNGKQNEILEMDQKVDPSPVIVGTKTRQETIEIERTWSIPVKGNKTVLYPP